MAAGLSLEKDDFLEFKALFDKQIRKHHADKLVTATIQTDGRLNGGDFNLQTCQLIQFSGPWGPEFDAPLFNNYFEVMDCSIIGKTENHLRFGLRLKENDQIIRAVAFNVDRYFDMSNLSMQRINAVFKLDINHYNSSHLLQVIIVYFTVES